MTETPASDAAGMGRGRKRVARGIAGVAAGSFALFVAVVLFDVGRPASFGADVDSRSAVGHRPFLDVLDALGIPNAVLRWHPVQQAGSDALLMIIEPAATALQARPAEGRDGLRAIGRRRGPVLLVLPKWDPVADPARPGHVLGARLRLLADVQAVLGAANLSATVVRSGAASGWEVGAVGATPGLVSPSQWLARSPRVTPIVSCDQGVLLGRVDDGRAPPLMVLSDPDVLATHGLFRGENALFSVGWIDRLRPPGGPVLVDAASQGRGRPPSLVRELFGWPLSLATITALVAVGLAAVSGAVRFGAPRPEASAFAGRTLPIVEHAAELALHGGHSAEALARYLSGSIASAARAAHVPPGLSSAETTTWLDRVATTRGLSDRVVELKAAVERAGGKLPDVLRVARRIHTWRDSFVHGPRLDP